MKLKIAVVIGHNYQAPGASAPSPIGLSEYEWNTLVARKMGELAKSAKYRDQLEIEVFNRKPASSYSREIDECYARVSKSGARASIELHFNDYKPGSNAQGTETLHSGSKNSLALAKGVHAAMLKHLGLRDRGLKERKTGRGARSVLAGRPPAILAEPFFASYPADLAAAAKLGYAGFAEMYMEGLSAYTPRA